MCKTILIVEDEAPLSHALSLKLQNSGYETLVAEDGAKALALLKKSTVDLVLLDLVMPNVDGFGVLEEVAKKWKDIPVIVSSNLSQDEDIHRAKSLGAKDFFIKSDTPLSAVIEKVKKTLE